MLFEKLTKCSSAMDIVDNYLTQEYLIPFYLLPVSVLEIQKQNSFLLYLAAGDDHITQFWSSRCNKSLGWDFRKAFIYLLNRDRLSFCPSCPCTPSTFYESTKLKLQTVAAIW